MSVFDVIDLAGGVALFLYGMSIMGSGLEKLAGGQMQAVLQKLTANTLRGVLLGTLITGVIQSSCGTIVIVVGLVNRGILDLTQAVGVIMGANIGTTVTGQLIRLADISGDSLLLTLIQPSTFSPVVAFIGAVLFVFFKSPKKRNIGQIMLGFGILFTGMFAMEGAVAPLRESPAFVHLFSTLQNPALGVLAGMAVTVAVQSSSASVGILQALSTTGVVNFGNAIPIILGAHIGTAFTPLVAAMGASKNAKRSAVIHLYFNVISSVVFLALIQLGQGLFGLPFWNSVLNKGSIANINTLTSVLATLCFFPFTALLVRLARLTVRDKPGEELDLSMPVLDERLLQSPAVALQQAKSAVEKMASRAHSNFVKVVGLFDRYDSETAANVTHREELLDKMEVAISDYLIKISDHEVTESEGRAVSELLKFTTEYERIGDYTVNLMECAQQLHDQELAFSSLARQESALLFGAVERVQALSNAAFFNADLSQAEKVEPLEETVDRMCEIVREKHIGRLKAGECSIEPGIVYLDVLTNLERISDHCSNIAARIIGDEAEDLDAHTRKARLLAGEDPAFNAQLAAYKTEYLVPLAGVELTS